MSSNEGAREETVPPRSPHAALRTAVVWDVLRDALKRRATAAARKELDVLDTGGGTGHFAVPVALLGHRVTVVDPSPNALFALERRVAEAGVTDRVRGVQGDAHGLFQVAERGGYDIVLCHGVLEYLDDPAEGLRNVVDALRPGGGTLSLLAAGLGGAVWARALTGRFAEARRALADPRGRWGDDDPVPRRFTAEQLTALVADTGLAVGAVHGVRVFTDVVSGALIDADPDALEQLEIAAAELPDFSAVATQLHVLAETAATLGSGEES